MGAKWELFDGKKIDGPFDEAQLLEAIWGGLAPTMVIRKAGEENWLPMSSVPQFALAAQRAAAERPPPPRPSIWRRPIAAPSAAALLIAFLLVNTFWLGLGASVEATCTTNGFGNASCTFTNRGILPGAGCVTIRMLRGGDGGLDSSPICTGTLWPRSTSTVEAHGAFILQTPASYCLNGRSFRDLDGKNWSDLCDLQVVAMR